LQAIDLALVERGSLAEQAPTKTLNRADLVGACLQAMGLVLIKL
jgi:hypothetical protein